MRPTVHQGDRPGSTGTRLAGAGRALSLAAMLPLLASPPPAACAEPTDGQGDIGRTSYQSLPFARDVFAPCWGCSPYLVPGELFFPANPASSFANPATMATARAASSVLEKRGIVPSGGAQRWEDTYEASFPAGTFPGEPAWIEADRARGGFPNDPAFVAWRGWIEFHPQYWDMAFDGGTMPSDPGYFRSWGGQWGHVSPLTPLDAADCPPGLSACTYGDLFAYQWGRTAGLSGGYGVVLADFSDSQPERSSNDHDFNPRIVAAFARATGVPVPQGGAATQARWIVANAAPAWNDFLSRGYAEFFAALAARIGAATSRRALIIDGCGITASYRRWVGTDERIIAQGIAPANYLCMWDDQVIQVGRAGPVADPPMQELAGAVVGAAREPKLRNGMSLEADDAAYRAAIKAFYPTLGAGARTEIGGKLLKRLWTWCAWAHIADRDGNVRRALAVMGRDNWDVGSLAALDPLATLIRTIVPTQPFGPALYYSTEVERAREQREASTLGVGTTVGFYLENAVLQSFIDRGGVVGYYVSDAALGRIAARQANAPSAWIVLDDQGMLPARERSQLAAIAPVVGSAGALAALANQPLAFTGGLTGFGFYDQNHRLIVVVSNPSSLPTATPLAGAIRLTQLAGSGYAATNLFTNETSAGPISDGAASLSVTLGRWDTEVFAFTTQ
jgi:hypothetical protein